MPRAYTPAERQRVLERLLETGRQSFALAGLGKVTIAQLARDAGIGKGSFYQFFDSKEELFLAIKEAEEATFKAALVVEMDQASSSREAVTTLLLATAKRLERHPFLRLLLDPQTLGELAVRIDPQRFAAHRDDDRVFFFSLVETWKQRGWLRQDLEPQTVLDVLGGLFMISVQRELLGVEATRRATEELAEALADRWCVTEGGG